MLSPETGWRSRPSGPLDSRVRPVVAWSDWPISFGVPLTAGNDASLGAELGLDSRVDDPEGGRGGPRDLRALCLTSVDRPAKINVHAVNTWHVTA